MKILDQILALFKPKQKGVFQVSSTFHLKGIGVVVVGKVQSGVLRPKMKMKKSDGKTCTVHTIEKKHQSVDQAASGDEVNLQISDLFEGDFESKEKLTF